MKKRFVNEEGTDPGPLLHHPLIEEDNVPYKTTLQEPSEADDLREHERSFGTGLQPHDQSINEERLDQLMYLVGQKVESYKADKTKTQEQASYSKILTTFADKKDKILITIGYLTAVITGLSVPSFVIIFGDIVNSFDPNT